jgi:hypothetical protein
MSLPRSTISTALSVFSAILLLGAAARLVGLNWPPLSDAEAQSALPALSPTAAPAEFDGSGGMVASSGAYQVLTAAFFSLFGASESSARLVPALFGGLLVAVPLLMRRRIGDSQAALIMLLLAISPTLVGASRSALDPVIGAFGVSLALASPFAGRGGRLEAVLLGIGGGLALASGPSVWFGLSGLLVAGVAAWIAGRVSQTQGLPAWEPAHSRMTIILALVSALVIASGAGFYFNGISTIFTAFSRWVSGWGTPEPLHPATMALAALAYEPLLCFLGLAGAAMAFRRGDRLGQASAYWAGGELVLLLLYPGRRPELIIWLAIPLAYLGGLSLRSLMAQLPRSHSRRTVILLGAACIVLAAFAFLQLRAEEQGRFAGVSLAGAPMGFVLALLAGLLAVGLIVLFGLGWSWRDALISAAGSAALVLLVLSIASLSRISFGDSAAGAKELWRPSASTAGVPRMLHTLAIASQAQTGFDSLMKVQRLDVTAPSILWALHAFPRLSTEEVLNGVTSPAVVAPEVDVPPEMERGYIGQTLALREHWGWSGALPPDTIRWLITGDAPVIQDRWLVMIRADIFGAEE